MVLWGGWGKYTIGNNSYYSHAIPHSLLLLPTNRSQHFSENEAPSAMPDHLSFSASISYKKNVVEADSAVYVFNNTVIMV